MALYEFHTRCTPPTTPVRNKNDVLGIVKRWDDFTDLPNDEIDFEQLEEDIHALAAIAMKVLPD